MKLPPMQSTAAATITAAAEICRIYFFKKYEAIIGNITLLKCSHKLGKNQDQIQIRIKL